MRVTVRTGNQRSVMQTERDLGSFEGRARIGRKKEMIAIILIGG